MSRELKEALDILEKEKSISKDTLLEAIEQSLIQACKNHFGKADNVHVTIDPETCDFSVYADRSIVEYVEDPAMEISLADALKITSRAEIGAGCTHYANIKLLYTFYCPHTENLIVQFFKFAHL